MWEAAFFDGNSAALRKVSLRFADDAIYLTEEAEGGVEIVWPCASLVLISAERSGNRIEISSTEAPGARLRVEGADICALIQHKSPHLTKADWKGGARIAGTIGAGLVALLAVLYFLPVLLVPLIPDSYAARLGGNTAATLRQFFGGACGPGTGTAILNALGEKLAASDEYRGPLQIEVIDSPIVNALALPGGRIMIFRGLIAKAESSDEVAGVLAHEMGHVEHRHGLTNLVRSLGLQMVIGALVGGTTGDIGTLLLSMSFSREAEMEADKTAIRILSAANISAEPFANFFDRLGQDDDPENTDAKGGFFTAGNLLASHPPTPERAAMARQAGLSAGTIVSMTPDDWEKVRAVCGNGEKSAL